LHPLPPWINRRQQAAEYLRTENQVLREKLGKRQIFLDDNQRRRLAVKGKVLGRKLLGEMGTLFMTDANLRWHHLLVAKRGFLLWMARSSYSAGTSITESINTNPKRQCGIRDVEWSQK
jgi:hypothetical protein